MVVTIAWVWTATRLAPNASPWQFDVGQILAHLLYFVPFTEYKWLNVVYWTLAIEFQYYLFIGLAFTFMRNIAGRGVTLAALLICLQGCATFFFPAWYPVQLLQYAPFFAMGMLGWLVLFYVVPRGLWFATVVVLCFVGYLGGLTLSNLAFGVIALLLILFWEPKQSWWRFFGTISYSLYVIHPPIVAFEHVIGLRLLKTDYGAWLFPLPFITMAICVAAAWVLYKLVEKPTMKLSKRIRYT